MAVTDTLINTVFDGRYLVLRRLGAGGMATVYLAEDQELGRRVAIKILNDRHAHDDQFVERFRREAKSAAGLSHPNIVSIYDRGEAEGTYYIAMEYLEGRTLKELIRERGPAPISTAIDYARQILGAVAFAHRNGIVHRDIKPHNVLVDDDGRLKVTDFGIARAGASQMTEVGSIIGTAQYLSPEQARGAAVDHRSDLYSVGVVLYELLAGQPPFNGETPLEIAMKHISSPPTPPSTFRRDVPRELDMVVLRALAKNPAERYQSAEEMDAELGRVAQGLGVSAETEEAATAILSRPLATAPTMVSRAPTVPRPSTAYAPPPYYEPPRRRRPVWPWLLALLLVAAAAIGLFVFWNQIQDQLNAAKPVTVPDVRGITLDAAKLKLEDAHLKATEHRGPTSNPQYPRGTIFKQDPAPGAKTSRDNHVDIWVSTGPPKIEVPALKGKTRDEAEAALTDVGLKPNVFLVYSGLPEGTVTAQYPPPGTKVLKGSKVRVNVSRGEKPIGVPSVIGETFDVASSTLRSSGFVVERVDVDSNQPKDTVLDQNPGPGTQLAKGGTVSLTVSKGPSTAVVPDVLNQDRATAEQTLRESGFKVQVTFEEPTDPSQNGLVIDQNPNPGARAKSGSVVEIVVGRSSGTTGGPR